MRGHLRCLIHGGFHVRGDRHQVMIQLGSPPVPGGLALCLRHGASLRPSPPGPVTIVCPAALYSAPSGNLAGAPVRGRYETNPIIGLCSIIDLMRIAIHTLSCLRLRAGSGASLDRVLWRRIAWRSEQASLGRTFDFSGGGRRGGGKPGPSQRPAMEASGTSAADSAGARARSDTENSATRWPDLGGRGRGLSHPWRADGRIVPV